MLLLFLLYDVVIKSQDGTQISVEGISKSIPETQASGDDNGIVDLVTRTRRPS